MKEAHIVSLSCILLIPVACVVQLYNYRCVSALDKLDSVYLMPYKQKSLVWYIYILLNDVIGIVLTVDAIRERQRQQGSEQQPLPDCTHHPLVPDHTTYGPLTLCAESLKLMGCGSGQLPCSGSELD